MKHAQGDESKKFSFFKNILKNIYFSYNFSHYFWISSRVVCISCALNNYYFTICIERIVLDEINDNHIKNFILLSMTGKYPKTESHSNLQLRPNIKFSPIWI